MELQLAVARGALESRNKLATKDATEHLDGKKEGAASFDPVRVISGESAGRDHAMDMRVKLIESKPFKSGCVALRYLKQ